MGQEIRESSYAEIQWNAQYQCWQWVAEGLGAWNIHEVWEAVDDEAWQTLRKSLKGISTHDKLKALADYLAQERKLADIHTNHKLPWKVRCRVQNYIGALKRGGQLSITCLIQR